MKPTYGGTLVFSCLCSGSPLCHHYTDTSLIRQVSECLSLYSEFQRAIFNGIRKRSLYWLGHLGAIYQRVLENNFHIPPEKTFRFVPCTEEFPFKWSRWETLFVHSPPQVVAGETKLFMRASAAIFKIRLPVVASKRGIFRTALMKKCKKIILPKLDRISKINFPTTCRE